MAKGLRVIVIPATQKIYMQAIEEGLVQTFIRAGAVVSTPTVDHVLAVIWVSLQKENAVYLQLTVTL